MAGPQTLGRYQLERVLGKGAMGIVYEALDPKLHRKVAIKTILINQLDEETAKDFSMRFVREAHAVARLNHPNIVQVYDFGEEAGIAFLVMEFIKGTELKSSLAGNQLIDRKECVRVMCELLDALDFAHKAGVIHRDIKPTNVMLDSQGRVKLTDFGVARITDSDKTSVEKTQAGTVVGSPAYMSPEQIQGLRIDGRTDIFSVGIILYQGLTGQKPFSGEGAWTVQKKIMQEEPPSPSSLNVTVSPEFDRVVAKALAKNPDSRFQTAREFAHALQRAAEGKAAVQEESAATVVLPSHQTRPAASVAVPSHQTETSQALKSGEMELEFWRSIKDSNDANDFDLYVRQFPQGVYATLAMRKIARMRGLPLPAGAEDSGTRTMDGTDRTRLLRPRVEERSAAQRPASERARTGVDKTVKLADVSSEASAGKKSSLLVPGVLGVLAVAGAAAYFVMGRSPQPTAATTPAVQTDESARREAAEKAKRLAEAQAKQEAEAQAKREAEARAKQEAEAQAKRDAEPKAKAAGKLQAKRDSELKAQRETEARAQREAEMQAQREAAARAQREAEARAQREAEAKAQREAETRVRGPATESAFWESIKASRDPADFRQYLSRYPKGQNADPARRRLARLEEEKRLEDAKLAKTRLEAEKRAERDRLAGEKAKLEAERKKDTAKAKPAIVVPTF
jgi:serine/threonine-protein kinase